MNYGKLTHSYMITATLGKAVEYHYCSTLIQLKNTKKEVLERGLTIIESD